MLAFQIELHAKQAKQCASANSSVYSRACLVCSLYVCVCLGTDECVCVYLLLILCLSNMKSNYILLYTCVCIRESVWRFLCVLFSVPLFQEFVYGAKHSSCKSVSY